MVGVHKQCNIVTHPPQHSMPSMCRHPPTQPSSIELHWGPAYPIHHPYLPHPNERNLSPKDPQSTWRSKLPLRCLLSTSDHKIIFETSSWWIQYNSSLSLSVLRYVTLLLLGHACWYVRPPQRRALGTGRRTETEDTYFTALSQSFLQGWVFFSCGKVGVDKLTSDSCWSLNLKYQLNDEVIKARALHQSRIAHSR